MKSICGLVHSKFLRRPNVFITTFTSLSVNKVKICSIPKLFKINVLIFCSAWKAMFWKRKKKITTCHYELREILKLHSVQTIKAHIPFSLRAGSVLLVRLHSKSTAPASTIGSLDGENSSNRLQSVDEVTVSMSSVAFSNNRISGFHTEWSWVAHIY